MKAVAVRIVSDKKMDSRLRRKVDVLLAHVFDDVDEQEVIEDFINPHVAHVLAMTGEEVIGWAGLHISDTVYKNTPVRLGGFGIGVKENYWF
jgi:hypothetical protein